MTLFSLLLPFFDGMSMGIQRNPDFSAQFGPTAGRKDRRRVICLAAQEPTRLQSRFCNGAITVKSSEGRGAGLLRIGYNLDDTESEANLGRSCRSETLARSITFAR